MPIGFITDEQIRAQLEEYGVARVKRMVSAGEFSTTWGPNIAKWLAEKDEEEERKKDALQAKQSKADQSTNWAAWAAVYVAVAAFVLAFLVWVLPHLWG
jgi:hypothetical protein